MFVRASSNFPLTSKKSLLEVRASLHSFYSFAVSIRYVLCLG
uniref:Uncharacterized protein n=1 Tax=Lepeophtheirus salmonis TaxID=72036 RepID=A0A0K2ULK8_LEPSM